LPRPLRLEHPGAFWHLYNRGVARRDIFLSVADRERFLRLLAETWQTFQWRIHTYTLMTNHYRLFVETPEPTLSRGMQKLDGDYAAVFNRSLGRTGPLFNGRFRAHLVEKESYFLELARYIVLNPVRARMVRSPADWRWSSYRATAGLSPPPPWLQTGTLLGHFDPSDRQNAMAVYREFVAAGVGQRRSPWEDLRAKLYLGSDAFIARIEELTSRREPTRTEPALQRNPESD